MLWLIALFGMEISVLIDVRFTKSENAKFSKRGNRRKEIGEGKYILIARREDRVVVLGPCVISFKLCVLLLVRRIQDQGSHVGCAVLHTHGLMNQQKWRLH